MVTTSNNPSHPNPFHTLLFFILPPKKSAMAHLQDSFIGTRNKHTIRRLQASLPGGPPSNIFRQGRR